MTGSVFTDGSCYKLWPPVWSRTGWAVVKMSPDGRVVLGWMRGVVGRALPRTSPASEHVAVLAAAGRPRIEECLSDYKGFGNVQHQPIETISNRKGVYSGIKVSARGLSPQMAATKVKAHVNKATLTDQYDIYLARGNDAADRIAKSAAEDLLSAPSAAEAEDWARQAKVLASYLWAAGGCRPVARPSLPRRAASPRARL